MDLLSPLAPPEVEPDAGLFFRLVRIQIDQAAKWKPNGNASNPPIDCRGLTLRTAFDLVTLRNQNCINHRRHRWSVVVRRRSGDCGYGVTSVRIAPESFPEDLQAVPPEILVSDIDTAGESLLRIGDARRLMKIENQKLRELAWVPRVWHVLSPVIL